MIFCGKNFDSVIIRWNNLFPLDKWYREKYKIAFNSKEHREISQIDIYFEWREDALFKKYIEEQNLKQKKKIDYANGNLVQERIYEDLEDEFDNIDISKLSQELNK